MYEATCCWSTDGYVGELVKYGAHPPYQVVTTGPGYQIASLGYDIGPSATNGTAPIVKEAATSGIIALMSGQNAVEIALDRADISAASRSTELESLAKGL